MFKRGYALSIKAELLLSMHLAGPLNFSFTTFIGKRTLPALVWISSSGTADSLSSLPQNTDTLVFTFNPLTIWAPHSPSPSPQTTISHQQEQNPKKEPAKFHTKITQAAPITYLGSWLPFPLPLPLR